MSSFFIAITNPLGVIVLVLAVLNLAGFAVWLLSDGLWHVPWISEPLAKYCASVRMARATLARFYTGRPHALLLHSVISGFKPTFWKASQERR